MRTAGWIAAVVFATIAAAGSPSAAWAARPPSQNVLEVVTVPPLPSAKFTLDGKPLVTDD
jgi:hypothetical protein